MARFDALRPFRPGLRSLARGMRQDPGAALLVPLLVPSAMRWMLEAAHIDLDPLSGPVKIARLTVLYARALRVWINEDGEDDASTMAELDRLLRGAESWVR